MVYCMSKWGALPSKMLKEDVPELGSAYLPMLRTPALGIQRQEPA
eukprot:CAMPEP_0202366446 /NCGR_PEP_ID=MMETSP1126-20121109/17058_1 /ASSEMBLY_ACC=CAM_ASM_000457 /TAXON_ID=3047 /ORGANISM="Dunaliella tertiolecta, Strain CCMP1320" /LENGTH=44 /DNA_ID= /DNA_START= /DNA_END= /DNA_ORIENTATION=